MDPAMLARVHALVERQQTALAQQQTQLTGKDFKITALTHELAYLKRIRYGKASEVPTGEQRSLFEDAVDMDLAVIEQELETRPVSNLRASAPAARRCRRNCRVSSTAMSLNRAPAASVAPTSSR